MVQALMLPGELVAKDDTIFLNIFNLFVIYMSRFNVFNENSYIKSGI